MAEINYKEYSRLRSIARKRIERASAAGRADYVRIPTVAEVRASANPGEYMSAVKTFLADPGASLTAARQTGIRLPSLDFTPIPPATKKTLTPEQKAERRREQKRRSKAKRAVEKAAANEREARRRVGYLKAVEKVVGDWKSKGVDISGWLGVLSPGKAKQFVSYMEYRFSQGDFNNKYVIDTFIRDFGELQEKNYKSNDIKADFEAFLQKQKDLEKGKRKTNKYGINADEVGKLWKQFVKQIAKEVVNNV